MLINLNKKSNVQAMILFWCSHLGQIFGIGKIEQQKLLGPNYLI